MSALDPIKTIKRKKKKYIWYTVLCAMLCVLAHRAHIPEIPESCWCGVLITHKLSPQPIMANYSQFMGS